MVEFFIGFRHIKERKFQSIFSIFGVAIAIIVFTVSITISNGLEKNMINSLLTLTPEISIKNYDDSEIIEYEEIINKIDNKNVKAVIPKISTQGIIKTDNLAKGILVDGIDGNNLKNDINLKIIAGEKNIDELDSILIGEELQKSLGVNVGDRIDFISVENKEIRLKVSGIFKTGFLQYDSNLIIIPLKTIQILSDNGEYVTEIALKTNRPEKIEQIRNELLSENLFNNGLIIYTWKDMNQSLLSAIKFEKFVLVAILSLLLIIASFAVTVILNMTVREKIKDIGILKSVGYTDKNIKNIFLIEGTIIGILGMIVASIVSPIILFILKKLFVIYMKDSYYYLDELPLHITVKELFLIYLIAILIVFISTIYPAYRASKLKPVEALKYE